MFSQWPGWLSRSPRIRRLVIKVWRIFLRVQRSTLGRAVLIVRAHDGLLLAFTSNSGELRLPAKELDGRRAVITQVEEWTSQLNIKISGPRLLAIEGTPSRLGVTFIYSAEVVAPTVHSPKDAVWLRSTDELSALSLGDRGLYYSALPELIDAADG